MRFFIRSIPTIGIWINIIKIKVTKINGKYQLATPDLDKLLLLRIFSAPYIRCILHAVLCVIFVCEYFKY